jgi:hypothetical protein
VCRGLFLASGVAELLCRRANLLVLLEHARELFPQSVRHGECLAHTRGSLATRERRKQTETG